MWRKLVEYSLHVARRDGEHRRRPLPRIEQDGAAAVGRDPHLVDEGGRHGETAVGGGRGAGVEIRVAGAQGPAVAIDLDRQRAVELRAVTGVGPKTHRWPF